MIQCYMRSTASETVMNDFGPAFRISANLGDDKVTVWYEDTDWGDDRTRGRKLSPQQARRLADVLESYAQMVDPQPDVL